MRINGVWVGWGLGDNSTSDFTVRDAKAFMRHKFASYAGNLADTNLFDQNMYNAVFEMQRRYNAAGQLHAPTGILDLDTEYTMGFKSPPPATKPLLFTVEGHMSNMFVGPCAYTASTLEGEGICHWQPCGYDNTSLPFNNASGEHELGRLLSLTTMDNGVPFPAGTPWAASSFSQGSIVWCQFFMDQVRNPHGALHWRYTDFRGALVHGNPYRQNGIAAEWVPDPPLPGTQGISDILMTDTPTDIWKEVSRHGDLYAENTTDEIGLDKTAIYKIAAENSWVGGPAAILTRILALFENPPPELFVMAQSIISGVLFVGNMDPHGGYDLGPGIDFMRSRLSAAVAAA